MAQQLTIQQAFELAVQHHQAGRLQEAEPIYRHILARQPGHANSLHHLGLIALQVGQKQVAVDLIRRAIGMDPRSPEAYNNLGNALGDLGQTAEAITAYRMAIALKPDYAAAFNNLGAALRDTGKIDEAAQTFRSAIRLQADLTEAHFNLADTLTTQGKLDEAIASYHRSLQISPGYAEAWNNLGHALHLRGKLPEAVTAIRRALTIKPEFPESWCNLGNVLVDQGDRAAAIAAYHQALKVRPDYAEAHVSLGNAMVANGELDQGIAAYQRAIAARPDFAEAFSNLGNALAKKRAFDDAITAYQKSATLKPDFFEAHYNLGNALADAGRVREATASCQRAVELNPAHPEACNNLGNVFKAQGLLDEAAAAYQRAIALRNDYPEALNGLGNTLKDGGQLAAAVDIYRRAIQLKPDSVEFHCNLIIAMQYNPSCSAQEIAAELARWNDRHAEPLRGLIRLHGNDRDPHRRLRIGYVSPDFRKHAVGQNILPLFQQHDHAQFEMISYSNCDRPDELTDQFVQLSDQWREIFGLSDQQVAERIREDRIDILVDLALHTAHNRLRVFAQKPAPVQVTFAGYPGSTGLRTIDFRLSDPYLDPPDADDTNCSETTVRLPHSFWCYHPQENRQIPVNPLPALEEGIVTFGCLNNFCKVNPPTIELWARVLQAVAGSRLLLLSHEGSHTQKVLDQFSGQGIDPERVLFSSRLSRRRYLELYHRIDLGLDSFPYNGHTTSLDSYWMGVPVVTMIGDSPVSRAGWCQLSNLQLTELAGDSAERFVQIAVSLATDLPRLAALRATLRRRMELSPLMDAAGFARGIESVYRQVWRRWCDAPTA